MGRYLFSYVLVLLVLSIPCASAAAQRAVDERTKREVEEMGARLKANGGDPRPSLDVRVDQLEEENRKLRAEFDALKREVEQLKAPANQLGSGVARGKDDANAQEKHAVTDTRAGGSELVMCTLLKKGFRVGNIENGDFQDTLTFALRLTNKSRRDIKALTGTLTFIDLFDREILSSNYTFEDGIRAGGNADWQGGITYNQFFDAHQRLRGIDQDKVQVRLKIKQVIYADGKRESFEQP